MDDRTKTRNQLLGELAALRHSSRAMAQQDYLRQLRATAEELLRTKPREPAEAMAEVDVRALFHELQVQQIELEMQHEELLITEQARAEKERWQHEERLAIILGSAMDAIISVDAAQRIVLFNGAAEKMFRCPTPEAIGKSLDRFIPERFRTAHAGHLRVFAEQGVSNRSMGRLGALSALRADGDEFPIEASISQAEVGGQKLFTVIVRDITQRKRAEESLSQAHSELEQRVKERTAELSLANERLRREQRTLEHMLQASDHERQLIAYDIHDGLAQELAGAIMQFEVYEHVKTAQPDQAQKAYDGGMALLRRGHGEARRLIAGVRPPILDEEGVLAAILHLVNERGLQQKPKIEVHSNVAFARLIPILENAIYRIVQEGLANACKHSRSEQVRLTVLQVKKYLRIEIRDWGVGFDTKIPHDNRYGLASMRERARLVGGKFRIQSKLNEGTSVIVQVPVVERSMEE